MTDVTHDRIVDLTHEEIENVSGGAIVIPWAVAKAVIEGAAIGATLYAALWTVAQ